MGTRPLVREYCSLHWWRHSNNMPSANKACRLVPFSYILSCDGDHTLLRRTMLTSSRHGIGGNFSVDSVFIVPLRNLKLTTAILCMAHTEFNSRFYTPTWGWRIWGLSNTSWSRLLFDSHDSISSVSFGAVAVRTCKHESHFNIRWWNLLFTLKSCFTQTLFLFILSRIFEAGMTCMLVGTPSSMYSVLCAVLGRH